MKLDRQFTIMATCMPMEALMFEAVFLFLFVGYIVVSTSTSHDWLVGCSLPCLFYLVGCFLRNTVFRHM